MHAITTSNAAATCDEFVEADTKANLPEASKEMNHVNNPIGFKSAPSNSFSSHALGTAVNPPRSLDSPEKSTLAAADFFDVFKIPDPPTPRSPKAFDELAYSSYRDILKSVSNGEKFRRSHTKRPIPDKVAAAVMRWLEAEERETVVPVMLPCLDSALRCGVPPDSFLKRAGEGSLHSDIDAQRKNFLQASGWTSAEYNMAKGVLLQISNFCAKNANGQPLEVVWSKVKELGVSYQKTIQNLLYVSANFAVSGRRRKKMGGSRLSLLDILDDSEGSNGVETESLTDLTDEIATYHDLLFEPTEQSVSIRVNLLVSQGKAAEAESLLSSQVQRGGEIRLRACAPVLRQLLQEGKSLDALRLFDKMKQMPLVIIDDETFVTLIGGLAENQCFSSDCLITPDLKRLGYTSKSGVEMFDELMRQMSDKISEIPMNLAKRWHSSFVRGFADANIGEHNSLLPLRINKTPAPDDQLIMNRVSIDPSTGYCSRSGSTLRLLHLDADEKENLRDSVRSMAQAEYLSFHKEVLRKPKGEQTENDIDHFSTWLDTREGPPFTAIVDGANVGYYMQNFDDGRFSFHQIKFVVDTLEQLGETVLVILPGKYGYNRFSVTIGGGLQNLTDEEVAIRNQLRSSGRLYLVPRGMLDDFYWIMASMSNQTKARAGEDISVFPNDPSGRWPGTRPVLVTNDQTRDHKLGMMSEPRLFKRWYSNYIVNYNFAGFVHGNPSHSDIGFAKADFYSREIQGNPSLNSNGQVVGTSWHFPLSDTEDNEEGWFCIRIPTRLRRPTSS
jgi:Protein-only RNase P